MGAGGRGCAWRTAAAPRSRPWYLGAVDELTAGRTPAPIEPPFAGNGVLLASQLCDKQTLDVPRYRNSTFANVSFKEAKVLRGEFHNCVFIECYLRRAELRNSTFVGCKFINCNFTHVTIRDCDFRYADFRGSAPPFAEMQQSAPRQANLRHELFESLARVADAAGQPDARRYRLAAIEALDKHLRAAVRAETSWYREHYDALGRIGAASQLFWHQLNRILWAHGESAWRLLVSALVVSAGVFPITFLLVQGGVETPTGDPSVADHLWLSMSNFLLLERLSDATLTNAVTQTLSALEAEE